MRSFLRRHRADLVIALGLLLLPLILFWPVVVGDRTLLPADNLVTFEPWKSAAAQFGVGVPHNKLLDDLVLENYPWKKFILESLRAGQLPLWNPYQFAGLPFLAAGQHSALYPFSLIFYLVPLPRAYGVFTVSQFFLAGLFMYIYLRVLGLRKLSAVFGAVAYELCQFLVVSVVFSMILAGAVWLPLLLTSVELMVRQHPALGGRPATMPWLALGSAALGVQVLAGHIEITYYTLLVAGAYSAWRLGGLWLSIHKGDGGVAPSTVASLKLLVPRAGALLALAVLGLGAGAIQFIPYLEVVLRNFRSGSATFEQIVGWAYPWRHALAFFVPNFFGNPSHHDYFDVFTWQWVPVTHNAQGQPIDTIFWGIKNYVEGGAYLGLLPLLLIPIVVLVWLHSVLPGRWNRPLGLGLREIGFHTFIPFFFLLALFSLAFAFQTRLYILLFWLPGINQLHSPFRWVWPLALSAAILSAYGLEYLWRTMQPQFTYGHGLLRRKPRPGLLITDYLSPLFLWASPSPITLFAGLATWGGSLIVVALVAARIWYDRVAGWIDFLLSDLELADQAFADGRMFFSYEARWVFIFALLLIASGIVVRLSRCHIYVRGRAVWEPLVVAVLALDLLVAGWGFNPASDPDMLTYVAPSVEFLRRDTELWRFTTYDTQGQKPFYANIGWYFNFYDVRGYDSIFSRQYRDYMELIQPQSELDFNRIAPISDPVALDSPLLDLLNVRYVLTEETIESPKYTLVYEAEVKIYRNETAAPRAYTMPRTSTLVTEDFGATIQTRDPRQYVIVASSTAAASDAPRPGWPAPAAITYYSPNEVYVDAGVEEASWLILADSAFPGWRAYVRPLGGAPADERPVEIVLVNGNFRGVRLEPGAWTVRFRYSPDSVKVGGIIAFVAGVTLAFGLGVWLWRFFYRESAVDSTARRVAKNSLAPMALNLLSRGIDLIFAAFYLRVLGPDDVGKYYFAIVVFGWFEIVTNYGLNTLLTRDVSRDQQHANRYLVNTTLLRLLLGLVAIPGLALLLGLRQLLPSPLTPDTLLAIALLVMAQAPATIATGLSALFYVYEKAEYPAAVATISTLLKVTLGTAALVFGLGFVGLAGASIVVNVVTLAILTVLVVRLFFAPQWQLDWRLQRSAIRESFPLMLNHLLATLFFKVDVPLLEAIRNQQAAGRGNREVGWYRTAYQFVDAYNIIPAFFTFALFPVMSRQAREDRAALKRSYALAVKLLVAVALPLAAATTFLAHSLIGLLGGADFLPHGAAALALMVWSIPFGWINSVTNYLLISLDQQRDLTRAFALALAFNVACNLLLIPRFGYAAAAAITIASEIFEGAWFYSYLRRSLGPLPWVRWLWRPWAGVAVMVAITYALWNLQPVLALLAGGGMYLLSLVALQAFDADERALLSDLLPARLRERLHLPSAKSA